MDDKNAEDCYTKTIESIEATLNNWDSIISEIEKDVNIDLNEGRIVSYESGMATIRLLSQMSSDIRGSFIKNNGGQNLAKND